MDFSSLITFLNHVQEEYQLPELECIVAKKHKILFRYFTNGSLSTLMDFPNHIYSLYSVTKVVTCAAALQLLEQDKFHLEDPLSKYFPEFAHAMVRQFDANGHKIPSVPAKSPIRIKHLFTMSAGLNYNRNTPAIQNAIREKTNFNTVDLACAIAQGDLEFEPGTHWKYSLCHEVLGALIERISQKRFGVYLRENLFSPLQMDDASYYPKKKDESRLAALYDYHPETSSIESLGKKRTYLSEMPNVEGGGGGLYATPLDMIRFADAMACGGTSWNGMQILKPKTIDMMRTNYLTKEILPDLSWRHLAGYGYGLGVRTMIDPVKGHSRSPIGEFGWNGAAGSYILMDPSNELSIFFATNLLNIPEPWYQPQLRNQVYQCMDL